MFNISKEEMQTTLQQLDQALYNHEQWLAALTRTIICRLPHDDCDVAEDAHRHCRFGQWCYNKPPQSLREKPAFIAMAVEHHRMHQLGAHLLLTSAYDSPGFSKEYDAFRNSMDRLRLEIDTLKHEIEDSLNNRDALTGAENRVRMLTTLRELHGLVNRRVHPCGIVIMDLDHFKTINDKYGHLFGDEVLATSVRHVMTHLRPYDRVFRYGGDEFLITLPDADLQITQAVIERIRMGLASLAFTADRPKAISPTASFGITQLDPDVSVEESINRADIALYKAKASGRNGSGVWHPSMTHKSDGESHIQNAITEKNIKTN